MLETTKEVKWKRFDPRYRNIENLKYYTEKTQQREAHRIFKMLQDHDRQSAIVAWGFVLAGLIFLGLVIAWVYTYVYAPLSGS